MSTAFLTKLGKATFVSLTLLHFELAFFSKAHSSLSPCTQRLRLQTTLSIRTFRSNTSHPYQVHTSPSTNKMARDDEDAYIDDHDPDGHMDIAENEDQMTVQAEVVAPEFPTSELADAVPKKKKKLTKAQIAAAEEQRLDIMETFVRELSGCTTCIKNNTPCCVVPYS